MMYVIRRLSDPTCRSTSPGLSDLHSGARGIGDGDRVWVFDDLGSFEVVARVSPSVRPGQRIAYHAWQPFQFNQRRSHQSVFVSPMNPIDLAGDDFQLDATMLTGQRGVTIAERGWTSNG